MRAITNSLRVFPFLIVLAGCGGSSTQPFSIQNFERNFEANVGASVIDYRSTSIPEGGLNGTANFQGALLLPTTDTADEFLIGEITLNANFASETLTGGASDFGFYEANQLTEIASLDEGFNRLSTVDGSLTVSDGLSTFSPFGYLLGGNLSGQLTSEDDTLDVDLLFASVVGRSEDSSALVSFGEAIGSIEGQNTSISYDEESGVNGALVISAQQ